MENNIKTLSIIGAGRLGKTLGRLFQDNKVFRINSVCSSTIENAKKAAAFIGAGMPTDSACEIIESDIYLIATPDGMIEQVSKNINFPKDSIVFHCSGSMPSSIIDHTVSASVHPVHSFAAPETSIISFSGSMCGCEGDKDALTVLEHAFEVIGGKCFNIDSDKKSMYHAAAVIACNCFVALQEASLQTFEKAGVEREVATEIIEPLVKGAVQLVFSKGTTESLTGPIARGDIGVVEGHLNAISDENIKGIYKGLSKIACELSDKQGIAKKEDLNLIINILSE